MKVVCSEDGYRANTKAKSRHFDPFVFGHRNDSELINMDRASLHGRPFSFVDADLTKKNHRLLAAENIVPIKVLLFLVLLLVMCHGI